MSATPFNIFSETGEWWFLIGGGSSAINSYSFRIDPYGTWPTLENLKFKAYLKLADPSTTDVLTEDVTGWPVASDESEPAPGSTQTISLGDFTTLSDTSSETVWFHFVVRNQYTGNDALYIQIRPKSSLSGSAADKFITGGPSSPSSYDILSYGSPDVILKFWSSRADAAASYAPHLTYDEGWSGLTSSPGRTFDSGKVIGIMCLLKGTMILTPSGYVKIETLKENDVVLNSKKEEKKIKSILYQRCIIDPEDDSKNPKLKHKYLLKKDSVKENTPTEDLILSGGHMIKIGDEFHLPINSDKLINIQEKKEIVEYYNIELDHYDFIIANGVEVESLAKPKVHKEKVEYYKERGIEYRDFVKPKK